MTTKTKKTMIKDKVYHFNDNDVCVDYDIPVRITTPQCGCKVTIAKDRGSWVYGLELSCIDTLMGGPCSRNEHASRYKTSRDAVFAALRGAQAFFHHQNEVYGGYKKHIINPMLAHIARNLVDYSTPSLFD